MLQANPPNATKNEWSECVLTYTPRTLLVSSRSLQWKGDVDRDVETA